MIKLCRALLLMLTVPVLGQGVRYDNQVTTAATNVPFGARAQVMTLPNASVSICGYPAQNSPCTNTVSIYSDQALTTLTANPITADALGRFGFFIAPGTYQYSVQDGQGRNIGTYTLSAPFTSFNGDLNLAGKIIAPTAIIGSVTTVSGVPSLLSAVTTTGTGSGSTISLAAVGDFTKGQGIMVAHGGAACGLTRGTACPSGPTPVLSTIGAAGSTSYSYRTACVDGLGGSGAAGTGAVTATGNASLSPTNANVLTMTGQAGCIEVAVYRNNSLVGLQYAPTSGTFTFTDKGFSPMAHRDIPTVPGSGVADNFVATITSIAGPAAVIAPSLPTSITGAKVYHSDTPMLQAAINTQGILVGGTNYLINFPLNMVDKGGTFTFSTFCDTGSLCLDTTGAYNLTFKDVFLNSYGTATQPSDVGVYAARDTAGSGTSQLFNTNNLDVNLASAANGGGSGFGTVGFYNYGAEIEAHVVPQFNVDSPVILTADNIGNVPSLFQASQLTGNQSMSQIQFFQPTGGTLGPYFRFESAYTIGIFGGYMYGGSSTTYPWAFEVYGQVGDVTISGYRTEGKAGLVHLFPGAIMNKWDVNVGLFRQNATTPVIGMEQGTLVNNLPRFIADDFGGSATTQPIFGGVNGSTSYGVVNSPSIFVGLHQSFDDTHGANNNVFRADGTGNTIDSELSVQSVQVKSGTRLNLLPTPNYLTGSTDPLNLDNLTACGNFDGNNLTNGPPAYGTGFMKILSICSKDPLYSTQIAFDMTGATNTSWRRDRTTGSWAPWFLNGGGFNGTRTAGTCVMTISNGLITAISGCS